MLKFFELNSIRHRMLSGFLFLTALILIVAIVSLYMLDQNKSVASIHSKINQLEIYTLNLIKTDNDFFDIETYNEHYFQTHQSSFLKKRDSLQLLISEGIGEALRKSEQLNYPVSQDLTSIDSLLKKYRVKFSELEALCHKRGFRDFGLEGRMRDFAHALEEPGEGLAQVEILSLRRIEKDFFLRHDTVYISNFNRLAFQALDRLKNQKHPNLYAVKNLEEYKKYFNELAILQHTVGLTGLDGLRKELNELTSVVSSRFFSLAEYSAVLSTSIQQKARLFYLIMLAFALLFSVISAFWISRRLSEPIARLSKWMDTATATGRQKGSGFMLTNAANEINALSRSFIHLIDQTHQQMCEIEEKSDQLESKNQELKKLNDELDSFLYSTAHDLRSPLTSLLGLVRLMRMDNVQPEMNKYINMMEGSIQRQEEFIGQIVNYTKNKKLEIVPEKIDLRKLIREIFENHQFIEGASGIRKEINIGGDALLYSDRNRITILFNNLISNAIRYSDPDKKEKTISIRIDVSGHEAQIEFSDNGQGIEGKHMSKIFEMFYRANFHSKGSGLGLFIFRETIQKLNGHVSVKSTPGVGTTFSLRIPNLSEEHSKHEELTLENAAR